MDKRDKSESKTKIGKHGAWVEALASGAATIRDDRGIVPPDLLGKLSNDDKAQLSDRGPYSAVELWPQLHHPVTFEEAWAMVRPDGGAVITETAANLCAGCWAVLVAGVDSYEGLIGRITADVLGAARAESPVSLSPHLHHAVMRFLDGLDPRMTVAELLEREHCSSTPLATAVQRKVRRKRR